MQFLLVLLAGFGIFAIPLDLAGQEKQRKITAGYLKGLKEPTQKILCNINLISRVSFYQPTWFLLKKSVHWINTADCKLSVCGIS